MYILQFTSSSKPHATICRPHYIKKEEVKNWKIYWVVLTASCPCANHRLVHYILLTVIAQPVDSKTTVFRSQSVRSVLDTTNVPYNFSMVSNFLKDLSFLLSDFIMGSPPPRKPVLTALDFTMGGTKEVRKSVCQSLVDIYIYLCSTTLTSWEKESLNEQTTCKFKDFFKAPKETLSWPLSPPLSPRPRRKSGSSYSLNLRQFSQNFTRRQDWGPWSYPWLELIHD